MDLRVGVSAVAMNWLIMLYFIILFAERVQSIVRSIRDKDVKLFGSGFDSYVYLAVFLSLAAFLVLLAVGNAAFLQSLFTMDMNVYRSIDYRMLSITAGVILVSGMVHTEYTIPGIQFASYGMLIAALVIKTACANAQAKDSVLLWMSLIYLILFSMAIPVMYHSEIEKATLFHVIEAVVSLALVAAFAVLMYKVLIGNAVDLFYVIPVAIAVIGEGIKIKKGKLKRKKKRIPIPHTFLQHILGNLIPFIRGEAVKIIEEADDLLSLFHSILHVEGILPIHGICTQHSFSE